MRIQESSRYSFAPLLRPNSCFWEFHPSSVTLGIFVFLNLHDHLVPHWSQSMCNIYVISHILPLYISICTGGIWTNTCYKSIVSIFIYGLHWSPLVSTGLHWSPIVSNCLHWSKEASKKFSNYLSFAFFSFSVLSYFFLFLIFTNNIMILAI